MTLKDIFKKCCGPGRNMQQYAADISADVPVSASSLYRISSGDIKSPVSDELLAAIVSHAAPGCGITEADIRAAVDKILSARVQPFEEQRKKMGDMIERSRSAVQNRILDSGASVRRIVPSSDPQYMRFDFGFSTDQGDLSLDYLFEVTSCAPRFRDSIDRFVGHMMLRGRLPENEWYYLVLVTPKDGRGSDASDIRSQLEKYLGKASLSANLGIILLSDVDGRAHTDEFRLSQAPNPVSFGS